MQPVLLLEVHLPGPPLLSLSCHYLLPVIPATVPWLHISLMLACLLSKPYVL